MAGKGPTPKNPNARARRNKGPELRVVEVERAEQPPLPTVYYTNGQGEKKRLYWASATKRWWKMWASSPLSREFTESDWAFLQDTALLHHRLWSEPMTSTVAAELRLRVSKFGMTMEDRARLRIQFAVAENVEGSNDRGEGLYQPAQEPRKPAQDPRSILSAVN